eukprot:CAMPEP_0202922200 /NCGR_PEP_ID=MMETSP1392-20130828/77799_1 /ASSEMBLY_ACC=CAM_ASM_000868 /TAXON_ID=225041 /ORGANISM="Chlamydomonas chlamydogama, Strain SAG 11-48b" /LENGTH=35 /DNA_ID= /DNA_START= /DNA_END= /DNA_ORIENTATION=
MTSDYISQIGLQSRGTEASLQPGLDAWQKTLIILG